MIKNIICLFSLIICLNSCSKPQTHKENSIKVEEESVIRVKTLKEKLDDFAALSSEKLSPEMKTVMLGALDKLRESDMAAKFLKLGDKAPNFSLKSFQGDKYKLYDLVKDNILIIKFYRGGWCPYCSLELRAYQEKLPEFKKLGAKFIAISPEMPDLSARTANKNTLTFPLLFDKSNKVAKKYHLVFELDDQLKPIYKQFGIDLETINGNNDWQLPVPATYIIGMDKKIKYAFADLDYKNRAEPNDVLEALRKI